jgi:uncharacterized protein (TIGR00304 family)
MQLKMLLPVVLFAAGICAIVASVASGESEASLVLIFPIVSGSGPLLLLGIVLIFTSFLAGFAMMVIAAGRVGALDFGDVPTDMQGKAPEKRTRYGGVVLIGPVPVAFGSDMKMARIMLVIGVILAVAFIVALLLL